MIKVIKTDADYAAALAEIERLVDRDPAVGTPEAEQLELLTLLVREYESRKFPIKAPDPIEAIRFRMEQQELTQRDLIPYIGSRSKVSEVLARKRPLTLSMIRALHAGLEIPAEALLQERSAELLDQSDVEWERFPVREMVDRGWIEGVVPKTRYEPEDLMRQFLKPLGRLKNVHALYRKTRHVRSARSMDKYALAAWTFRITIRAIKKSSVALYKPGTVTLEFMRQAAQLSWSTHGPVLAQEFLEKHGIPVIVEPHLPRTHLDAAAILIEVDKPVIGLTLRHDRIDNFWFCLMHELAHVALHLKNEGDGFYDDLDAENEDDPREREADKLAGDALMPEAIWNKSPARNLRSPEAAQHLAEQLRIHPAIVAGRMRYESRNFRILNQLIGRGEARKCFPEVEWNRA
jgi:HTH-type transcriptional regulator/antitoxin HigA